MNRSKVLTSVLIVALFACLANVAYLWAQPPAVPADTLTDLGINTPYVISVGGYSVGANEVISATRAAAFITLNTGHGANELYAMNQDVESTDAVTFATVDTGQGANELYGMDQGVESTDNVVFNSVDTEEITLNGTTINSWTQLGNSAGIPYTFIIKQVDGITYAYWANNQTLFNSNTVDNIPIQAGLEYLNTVDTGGHIYVKAGVYTIETTLTLYSNTGIIGEGGDLIQNKGTIFLGGNDLDDNVMEFDTTPSGGYNLRILLRDFAIDGNDVNNTNPGSRYDCNGIHAFKAIKCLFENLEIRYINDIGIWLNGTNNGAGQIHSYTNTIKNCYITDCYRGVMTSYSEENQILNVQTGVNDQNGMYITSDLNLILGGVSVYDGDGIRMSGYRNTIIGWSCDRPDQSAIEIDAKGANASLQLKIIDCHFQNPSESANATYPVIWVGNYNQYILVEGCSLWYHAAAPAYPTYVIDLGTNCDYWIIKNNDFRLYATAWIDQLGYGNNVEEHNWTGQLPFPYVDGGGEEPLDPLPSRFVGFSGYPYDAILGGVEEIDDIINAMADYDANCYRISFNPPDASGSRPYNLTYVQYFLDNTPDFWYIIVDANHYVSAMTPNYPVNETLCLERIFDVLGTYGNNSRVLIELWNEPAWGYNTSERGQVWIDAIRDADYTNGIVVTKFSPYFLATDTASGFYDPWVQFDDALNRTYQSAHIYMSLTPPAPETGMHGLSWNDYLTYMDAAGITMAVYTEVGAETDETPFSSTHVLETNTFIEYMASQGYGYTVWLNGDIDNLEAYHGYYWGGLDNPLP